MFDKIKSALKSPVTYVALIVGGILVLAYYSVIGAPLKTIADKLPGSDASKANA